MHRNSFFFCAVFAFLFSACDPGTGPGGLGDVRDDIEGEYGAEVVDYEYICPPNYYLPRPSNWITVLVSRSCTDPEQCTPEELEGGFTIVFNLLQDGSGTWNFNSDVLVSPSGEFNTAYTLHFFDGTAAEVVLSGVVRHGALEAFYMVDVDTGGGTSCRTSVTIRGERDVE